VAELSPTILSAFVAERSGAGLAKTTVRSGCGILRVFLRYGHRQGLLAADLSKVVEWPTAYQLAGIPAIHHLGRGGARARCRRPPHPVRQARLRDLAAAGDLRPAGPRGRGPVPGRHRLEARPAGHPRPQGRAFHRVPAVGRGRRGPGGLPAARAAAQHRPARVLPGGSPPCGPSAGSRSLRAPGATCSRPGSPCPARGRTRCGIPASSGWSTTVSGSRPSGTSSGTARRPPRPSMPTLGNCIRRERSRRLRCQRGAPACFQGLSGWLPDQAICQSDPVWCKICP
jgi:hypothetical protein